MKNIMGTLAFGLFISLFFIVGFGMLGFAGYSLYKSKSAEQWPTADGKITFCELKENSDSDGNSYQVNVKKGVSYGALSFSVPLFSGP